MEKIEEGTYLHFERNGEEFRLLVGPYTLEIHRYESASKTWIIEWDGGPQ